MTRPAGAKGDKGDTGATGAPGTPAPAYTAGSGVTITGSSIAVDPSVISFRKTVINTYSGSAAIVAADAEALVRMNVTSANTYTVPANATVPLSIGTTINVQQVGSGQTSIAAASGVTIQSDSGYVKLKGQYAAVTLIKAPVSMFAPV